ncbi:MAG: nitroreductase family protein [Prevotellaceae bacterium]|jgi:nitroreductase|nr:nitroreductase family protein [Prevotellaceae bacterium]
MTDFLELVKKRQSVRKYSSRQIEEEKINRCIEAARLAPSACNAQPWKFVIVDNPELKLKVAEASESNVLGFNKFTKDCPVIVAVVRESPNITSKMGMIIKDKPYPIMDVGIAVAHFCLQAAEENLGTCIIGWFNEKKIKKLLGIPKRKRLDLLISAGYAADETILPKQRKSLAQMSVRNKYE